MMHGSEQKMVSVIVPVYNAEKFVEGCVESLVSQTYPNVEIILVNDGSKDQSPKICDALAEKHKNIRVIHKANAGVSAARNDGMKAAKGEYIHFCDSDDTLEPETYQEIIDKLEAENADVAYFGWFVDTPDGQSVSKTDNALDGVGNQDDLFETMLCLTGAPGGNKGYGNYIWNKIYRRTKLLDSNGEIIPFDTGISIAEDGLWLVHVAQNWQKGVFSRKAYYHYVTNPNSAMNKASEYARTRLASQATHIMMLDVLKAYNRKYFEIHRNACTKYFWMTVKGNPEGKKVPFLQQVIANVVNINEGQCPENIAKDVNWYMGQAAAYKKLQQEVANRLDIRKVGILTFHRAINYGALLQGYALQEKLKDVGLDAWMVDYRCPFVEAAYKLTWGLNRKKWSSIRPWLLGIPDQIRKKRRFRAFARKHLNLSRAYKLENVRECEKEFDGLITGSDQVWNMKNSGDDHSYMLDFVTDDRKKLSYAVSLGAYEPTGEEEELIRTFSKVSFREKNAVTYSTETLKKEAHHDIDPTLLLTKEQWEKLVLKKKPRKPYIFIYSVHPQNRMVEYARKLAAEKGLEIYHLHNRVKKDIQEEGVNVIFDCSPQQFLTWIHNADYVITNSFHGTVFSILFERPFLSELETRGGFNNRVWELLRMLGIQRRILDKVPGVNDGVTPDEPIDWKQVKTKMQEQRKLSVDYLKSIRQ